MTFDNFKVKKDKIRGSGSDGVGEFKIKGSLNDDQEVTFVKQYIGQHAVNYTGKYSKDDKTVEGDWEVSGYTGTFKITKVGK